MKNLLIVRHAKSSWASLDLEDFDRPLNDRGNHDAPMMAKRLLKKDIKIDAFVSSTAVRALATATYFAKAYDQKSKHIIQVPTLYEAPYNVFYQVISKLDDDIKTAAVFAHNPGITDFVNSLTNVRVDNIPTCGVFAIKIDTKHWQNLTDANKEFWFFDYPKSDNQ